MCVCVCVPKVFANRRSGWGSIPGLLIPKTQKYYLIPACLTHNFMRYGSRISRITQEKEQHPLLNCGVVVIEKEDFRSPSTTVG